MLKSFNRAGRHLFFFALGSASTSLISFMLIPVYTRALSPNEYGSLEVIRTTITVTVRLLSLELSAGLLRRFFLAGGKDAQDELISTAFWLLFPFAAVTTLALAAGSPILSNLLFGSSSYTTEFQIASGAIFLNTTGTLLLAVLRAHEKSLQYSFIALAQFVLTISFILFLVVQVKQGVFGALVGELTGYLVIWTFLLVSVRRNLRMSFSIREFRNMLSYSLPFVPANFALAVLNSSDRFFLNYFLGPDDVAVYSVAAKIASLITVALVVPFWLAWPIIIFPIEKEPYAKQFFSRIMTYTVVVGSGLVLGLSAIAPYAIRLMAPTGYSRAADALPLVASAQLVYLTYPVLSTGVRLRNQTKHVGFSGIVGALSSLLCSYLLVPRFGLLGAPMGVLVGYLVMTLWAYFPSQIAYPIQFEWNRVTKVVILAGLLSCGQMITLEPDAVDILYRVILLIAFPAVLLVGGFLEPEEANELRRIKSHVTSRLDTIRGNELHGHSET